jgi:hypothetical protein
MRWSQPTWVPPKFLTIEKASTSGLKRNAETATDISLPKRIEWRNHYETLHILVVAAATMAGLTPSLPQHQDTDWGTRPDLRYRNPQGTGLVDFLGP